MDLTKDFFNLILDFGDQWLITDVEADHNKLEVYIDIKYVSDDYKDPDTLEVATLYDHSPMREWRHLDVLHYKSYVRCQIPRVKCLNGTVKQIGIGWAGKHDRHTYHFEIKAIDTLKATRNQTKTAELLNCSFRMVNRIMHTSTKRGMKRRDTSKQPFEHIGIDEKSFRKGHSYITVISHPVSGIILDVGEDRDGKSVSKLLDNTFTEEQLKAINTVSMDMWKAYINAVENQLPNAEIVHDKFHLIKYLNKSIDDVRRREVLDNEVLKNSRYALLKNEENLTIKQKEKYDIIKQSNLEVTKAWNIRENFKSIFDMTHEENGAKELLKNWAEDSFMSNIKEVNKVILMFLNHTTGVVNALISGLNNAMAERLNGKIQELKTIARGYRTFKNFRSAILFFNGGLDLFPLKW